MTRPSVYLALPHRDATPKIPLGALRCGERGQVRVRPLSRSLLPHCFNALWCGALNERPVDVFCMMHDDILPAAGWLDALLAELDRTGADVLSVVVPLKDERGLTSTAVRHPETGWLRRLTIRETERLPETFDAGAAGHPGQTLLVNTGCFVCRFDAEWVERIVWREEDGIHRDRDGRFYATVLSEDWLFSMDAADLGLKVLATRKIPVKHVGPYGYPNGGEWGSWGEDYEQSAPLTE